MGSFASRQARRRAGVVTTLLTGLIACLLAVGAAPAGAVEIGISDSDAPTVVERHWAGLGVSKARVVVPYDVAIATGAAGVERRERFETYRANATAQGVSLLVVFASSADIRAPGTNEAVAPSGEEFSTAFAAFRQKYPDVTTFGAWNEPNNPDSRTYALASSPELAAEFWLRAQAICGAACTVAAGGFAGIPGDDAYVDAYLAALGEARPAIWAFHTHSDVNAFQAGGPDNARIARYYLGKLQGPWAGSRIWIDEVGARFRDPSGTVWGDASQAQAAQFLLGLASLDPRIDAIYYYNYSNQCSTPVRCAVQDRGLVSPSPFDGQPLGYDEIDRPRGAYRVIADRGPVIPPAELVPPVVTIDAPGQSAALNTRTPAFAGQAATGGRAAAEVTLQIFPGAGATEGSAPLQTLTAPVAGGRWSATAAALADGVYTARATQAGNPSSAGISQDTIFTVDTVAPTSAITSGPPAVTGAGDARLEFAASEPGATFACAVDGGAWQPCASPLDLAGLRRGAHKIAIRATDAAGNRQQGLTRHSWRVAALVSALTPRASELTPAFAAGMPVATSCAGPCRVTARLYATREDARRLGLSGRPVSRNDVARPRSRGTWVTVGGASQARKRAGAGTLPLRVRAGAGASARWQRSIELRLGLVLNGDGAKPVAVRKRVTLMRGGTLRSAAARGLPLTVACSFGCTQRTDLWAPAPLARAVRAPGRGVAGGGSTGLPRGLRYVTLASRSSTRASGGASDVAPLPARGAVRTRLGGLRGAGVRVTARITSPGVDARTLSLPLTLAR